MMEKVYWHREAEAQARAAALVSGHVEKLLGETRVNLDWDGAALSSQIKGTSPRLSAFGRAKRGPHGNSAVMAVSR
jgi:hypothetical protein